MLLGELMRDDLGAEVLERLATGNVIEMMMAVDQVFDRLVGDLLDFVDVGLHRLRPQVADRIGRDHALLGDDEHRLMALIAEDIDVLRAVDLGGREWRWRCRGGRRGRGGRSGRRCLCGCRGRQRGQRGRNM